MSQHLQTQRRRRAGVTLLELAIAIAVLAILGSLALPPFAARVSRERLTRAAETLSADISQARFLAAREGRALHLRSQAGTDWCWSVSAATVCDCAQPQSCQIRRVPAASFTGVALLEANAVDLAPDGTAAAPHPVIATMQARGGERLAVQVGPLGRPHICAAVGRVGQYPAC